MKLVSNQLIWQNNQHNAFTDLCQYQGRYYCCFRQATNHVSKDGFIRVLVSNDTVNWQLASIIKTPLSDLRDPKLGLHPSGKLVLMYYHKLFNAKGQNYSNQNRICFSENGITWSAPKIIAENNWWLWRIRWFGQQALGIAYNRSQNKVKLYQGDPLRGFLLKKANLFGLCQNGKGYPNESDICFLNDGSAICILRRDADSFTAQLGIAKPGYQHWQWFDLGEYLGGPALLKLNNGKIILAARRWLPSFKLRTWLFEVDVVHKSIKPILQLPSAGDNSYPAMLEKDNELLVSYYSQHHIQYDSQHNSHNKTQTPVINLEPKKSENCAIYLARIALSA